MFRVALIPGALILSALLLAQPPAAPPAAEPAIRERAFSWFSLTESPDQVRAILGRPALVASTGADYLSWQFQIGEIDHHDFSHVLLFRKSSSVLVSATRIFEPERTVDEFFPPAETSVHHYPNAAEPVLSLRLRRLSGGGVLMAIGSPAPGRTTGQLVLMREDELPTFYPWLAAQLSPKR